MALRSIQIVRGFFSDYWVGSVLSQKKSAGAKITPLQARRKLERLATLYSRVDFKEEVELAFFREKFARPLLREILSFEIIEDKTEPRIRLLSKTPEDPDVVSGNRKPLAALALCTSSLELETRQVRQQLEKALLEHNIGYGFILSPQALRIIRKPGEGNKGAYLDISFASLVSIGDDESLLVAYKVFAAENFESSDGTPSVISFLEAESRQHSAKVSEDLKVAVFQSAEILIQGFVHDTEERVHAFTATPALLALRDAALLTLYRLLFILYAESRDDRLQQHPLYQRSYSLETLIGDLLKTPRENLAANSFNIWQRILTLFKIFDEGLPKLPDMQNIPPRGGTLFSHSTPEGKLISSLQLPDTTAAELLLMMATTRPRRGVGRERISFRELAIEQLGSVYEGLLEHEPRIASELLILCKLAGKELALTPSELARVCREKKLTLVGEDSIVAGTECSTLFADTALDEESEEDEDVEGDNSDEDSDEDKGIKKGGAVKLLRRVEQGTFIFIPGTSRKSSGSFYTPDEMVQYLANHSLNGLLEGKSPSEIEALRIIDIACGSGHFLVGTARVLGKALFDSYNRELKGAPPKDFAPYEDSSGVLKERWQIEGEAWSKRRIVERCLFGVDLNPTAVQLAQVALWIESLAGDRPLSFFAHHVRCGNSLIGTWRHRLQLNPLTGDGKELEKKKQASLFEHVAQVNQGLFEAPILKLIQAAMDERMLISHELPKEIRKDSPDEYRYKADRLKASEKILSRVKLLFDLRSSSAFIPDVWHDWQVLLGKDNLEEYAQKRPWWQQFKEIREREKFFHWELEFPEVFLSNSKGFDVVVGNPPWEKIKPDRKEFYSRSDVLIRAFKGGELDVRIKELQRITPTLRNEFEQYEERLQIIVASLKKSGDYKFVDWKIGERSTGGDPDLFKFFTERAHQILAEGGRIGYVLPSALYNNEGCTGLRHLLFEQSIVRKFFGFENANKIFPIDSRYKFVSLVAEKTSGVTPSSNQEFEAIFMRRALSELIDGPPTGVTVLIKKSELDELSPGTLAFLEYRDGKDQEIARKMYGVGDVRTSRPLLGDKDGDSWGCQYYTDFHMTNDRDLWTKPNGKLWTTEEISGLILQGSNASPFSEVRAAMKEKGFLPLYEGKHIDQFLVNTKPIEKWVCLESYASKYKGSPNLEPKLVFRDIARNTDERTLIAAVLPPGSCFGNTLGGLRVKNLQADVACTILNALSVDFTARMRIAGTHLNWTYVSRLVAPGYRECLKLKPFATVTLEKPNDTDSNLYDDERNAAELMVVNQRVAVLFGLNDQDLRKIVSRFPLMLKKRPSFRSVLDANKLIANS